MKLQKHNRIKDEVFDNKNDAEDFLKKSKKQLIVLQAFREKRGPLN